MQWNTESDPSLCKTWPSIELHRHEANTNSGERKLVCTQETVDTEILPTASACDCKYLNTSLQKYLQSQLLGFNTIDN